MNTRTQLRFLAWAALVIALPSLQLLWLRALAQSPHPTAALLIGQALCALLLLPLLALLKSTPPEAIRLSPRLSITLILSITAALQATALWHLTPTLSEDAARYRLEGLMWRYGVSPYATSPAQFLASRPALAATDSMVPFPHSRTIYGPAAQALFFLARTTEDALAWTSPRPLGPDWRHHMAAAPWRERIIPLRIALAICLLLATLALCLTLRHAGLSPWYAVLFAWNPLLTLEFAGNAHIDALGVAFLAFAFLFASRHRFARAALFLTLAIAVKPLALLLAPWLLLAASRSQRPAALRRTTLTLIASLLLCFAPALLYQQGHRGLADSARTFSDQWEANGSFYEAFKSIASNFQHEGFLYARAKIGARLIAIALLAWTCWIAWRVRTPLADAAQWLFLCLFLLAPVAYPWYIAWPLVALPLARRPSVALLAWTATIPIAHLLWRHLDAAQPWRLTAPEALLEYLPVYLLLSIEITVMARARRRAVALLGPTAPCG